MLKMLYTIFAALVEYLLFMNKEKLLKFKMLMHNPDNHAIVVIFYSNEDFYRTPFK
jgi:hypothetical protein